MTQEEFESKLDAGLKGLSDYRAVTFAHWCAVVALPLIPNDDGLAFLNQNKLRRPFRRP